MHKQLGRFTLLISVIIITAAYLSPTSADTTELDSVMQYTDIEIGTGDIANVGDVVVIHFSGWIDDNGKKGNHFFNSRDRGEPISFKVGTDKVIQGWNIGVTGMQVGGKRRLQVPSKFAYGIKGTSGIIPPDATLIYEIELLEVK